MDWKCNCKLFHSLLIPQDYNFDVLYSLHYDFFELGTLNNRDLKWLYIIIEFKAQPENWDRGEGTIFPFFRTPN